MLKRSVLRAMTARASQDIELANTTDVSEHSNTSPQWKAPLRRHTEDGASCDVGHYSQYIESIVKLQRFFRVKIPRPIDTRTTLHHLRLCEKTSIFIRSFQASSGLIGFLRFWVHLKVLKRVFVQLTSLLFTYFPRCCFLNVLTR
jgi:hypothetical protein